MNTLPSVAASMQPGIDNSVVLPLPWIWHAIRLAFAGTSRELMKFPHVIDRYGCRDLGAEPGSHAHARGAAHV